LLINTIITWCVVELVKNYQDTDDDVYIEYAVQMIEAVGEIYEERTKSQQQPQKNQSQPPQNTPTTAWGKNPPGKTLPIVQSQSPQKIIAEIEQIDKIFAHFNAIKPSVSNRVRFMILNLEEMRANGWKKRSGDGDKGPKTVAEYDKKNV